MTIVDSEMVLGELLGPADLSRAQTLYIHEMTEVIIFRKDKNLMLVALEIVTLRVENFDNSQKLTIVDLVSSLCRNHFPRKEYHWVPLA